MGALIGVCGFGAAAQDPWIHVYGQPNYDTKPANQYSGIGTFYSLPMNEVDSVRFTTATSGKFNRLRLYSESRSHKYSILIRNIIKWEIGPNVPTFHIDITDDPKLSEVESKTDYLNGSLRIEGCGIVDDFTGDMQIRGRGNSTWNYPKKAYRIKFPEKTKICGYKKAKNYVLLANFIDYSMMRNEAACLAAQYVGMPYPTHAMPVDVYFNKALKGSYMLMEKVGFNNGSVDLKKEDEANSIMFELDTNYDEPMRQASKFFRLPVMLKDPDAPADPAEAEIWYADWMADFNEMDRAVYEGRNIGDYIDYTTLAKYLICYNLACNQELNHPKSVYLYKTKGGKYQFGPCWDFDWAYGYQPTYRNQLSEEIDDATARQMIDDILAYIEANGIKSYTFFEYNGGGFVWFGEESFMAETSDGRWNSYWPYGQVEYAPSYRNYLLGYGRNNQNTQGGIGNGGEFFLSIIMNNPEFMKVYKTEWEAFKTRLPEFWEEFDAYAASLRPTAWRNTTVWSNFYSAAVDREFYNYEDSTEGAIEILRTWLQKRIEFIDDESCNFGLYDPRTEYVPASSKQ